MINGLLKRLSMYSTTVPSCSCPATCEGMVLLLDTYSQWSSEHKVYRNFVPDVKHILSLPQRRKQLLNFLFDKDETYDRDRVVEMFRFLIAAAWIRHQEQVQMYRFL